jgi:hypothetical protein
MTTADDRHDDDVWAEAVADGAREQAGAPADGVADELAEKVADKVSGEETAGKAEAESGDLFGPELSPLVDEVRRFAATLGEKVTAASASVSSGDSLGALQGLAAPLRSKHPEVYGHLIAAGGELLAAYRAAVAASERRWTTDKPPSSEQIDLD